MRNELPRRKQRGIKDHNGENSSPQGAGYSPGRNKNRPNHHKKAYISLETPPTFLLDGNNRINIKFGERILLFDSKQKATGEGPADTD
jgi:hypothetical protein